MSQLPLPDLGPLGIVMLGHSTADFAHPAPQRPLDVDVAIPDPESPNSVALDRQIGESLPRLVATMRRLLGPNGCPWDLKQTPKSLTRYVLEEAAEVIDAIDEQNPILLQEELGDLLLQVVFQAELARNAGHFGPDDVIEGIVQKLVRRHPHVFGTLTQSDGTPLEADGVLRNWEQIKLQEKGTRRLLEGIPRSLPSLVRAQRTGEKVARVGFDWPDIAGSRAKVTEELTELDEALDRGDLAASTEEFGDLLFALVNLARHVPTPDGGGIDAEAALRRAVDKFHERFSYVEDRVRFTGGFEAHPSLQTMDGYWNEAKARPPIAPRSLPDASGETQERQPTSPTKGQL